MQNKSYFLTFTIIVTTCLFFTAACFKQSAKAGVNTQFGDSIISIQQLRKIHAMGGVEMIGQALLIEGVVVANDEHDNIYKSIYVQDKTGAIAIQLDGLSLYQSYPVGALLRINVRNLFLTDYRRMVQLVAAVDSSSGSLSTTGIPSPMLPKFIKTISDNSPIHPLLVAYKNLGDSLQGRLIQLNGVEFSGSDTGQTYADKKNKLGISRSLKFCTGGTIYLRTSGYADFASVRTPAGNGIIIGVYSVFNAEKQIILRDTNDILLNGKRCTGAAWLQNLPLKASKRGD